MSIKNSSCDETLTTSRTNVRSFARVISLVNNQRGPLRESLAALIARVLPFSGMYDLVGPQQGLASKTFAAHLAGVRLFAGMRSVMNFEALRRLQLLAALCAKVPTSLVERRIPVGLNLVLLQHRLVFIDLVANVAFVFRSVLVRFLESLIRHDRRIVMVETIMLLQAVHVIKDAAACAALLILHKIVHRRVRDQSVLVDEILAANLAREFRGSMMSFPVPFHIGRVDTHEIALVARHRFQRVRFFHVGVKHELLGIILATGDTLEGSMNAVCYS